MNDDGVDGRRLSALLSSDPVVGEGQLDDGTRWTLRWSSAGSTASMARAVLAVAAPGAGYALVTIELNQVRGERSLNAAWMSTPAASGPQLLGVVAGAAVDRIEVDTAASTSDLEAPGSSSTTIPRAATVQPLHSDPDSGRSVFLVQGLSRVDDVIVVGRDTGSEVAGHARVAGIGREREPEVVAQPEVSSRVGWAFAAATVFAALLVVGIVTVLPATAPTRVACVLVGLLTVALPTLRRAVAKRAGEPPRLARATHHYISVAAAVFGVYVATLWALGPSNPALLLILGAVVAAIFTGGHRQAVVRSLRRKADAGVSS